MTNDPPYAEYPGSVVVSGERTIYLVLRDRVHSLDTNGSVRWSASGYFGGRAIAVDSDSTIYAAPNTEVRKIASNGSNLWGVLPKSHLFSETLNNRVRWWISAYEYDGQARHRPDRSCLWIVSKDSTHLKQSS